MSTFPWGVKARLQNLVTNERILLFEMQVEFQITRFFFAIPVLYNYTVRTFHRRLMAKTVTALKVGDGSRRDCRFLKPCNQASVWTPRSSSRPFRVIENKPAVLNCLRLLKKRSVDPVSTPKHGKKSTKLVQRKVTFVDQGLRCGDRDGSLLFSFLPYFPASITHLICVFRSCLQMKGILREGVKTFYSPRLDPPANSVRHTFRDCYYRYLKQFYGS
ncbi:hypothetical protein PoB_007592000 [Plakobranchus ocellatus]|uniref:Uncharacterized protein n=1 Tax=Plakobranchus ocellatus TaxID=259542 RepID=A0AAV4DZG7_9GAST|nr:hypothetical protein PoB_007592000 [Plakobranchus ocellatus]